MGRASYSMWLTLVEEYTSNGSDISCSNLQVGQRAPKVLGPPVAGFLSLSQTGHSFGLFKPNGTGVAKKSPRAEGGRGEVNSPLSFKCSNTQTTRVGGFGSLWAPFWLPLAHWVTFGSRWLTFSSLWLPLGPFWLTFGVPWLTFGALSFTFAHPGLNSLTFAVSCLHFSYFFEFYMKISCKV